MNEIKDQIAKNQVVYSIGIDPGWRNCGIAIVKKDENGTITKLDSCTFDVSSFGDIARAALCLFSTMWSVASADINKNRKTEELGYLIPDITFISIERYVSYQNVTTAEAENILMFIGALYCEASRYKPKIELFRAIDWKTELVKLLFKQKGFSNPSTKLDKKFSIAAAKACFSEEIEIVNDHEADALAIACLPFIREVQAKKEAERNNVSV